VLPAYRLALVASASSRASLSIKPGLASAAGSAALPLFRATASKRWGRSLHGCAVCVDVGLL